jgi:hypothetical protein
MRGGSIGRLAAVIILLTCFAAVPLLSRAARQAETATARRGRVSDAARAAAPSGPNHPDLLDAAGRVWVSSRGTFAPSPKAAPPLCFSAGYSFVPARGDASALLPPDLQQVAGKAGPRHVVVQFRGPIIQEDRATIEALGGRIVSYLPDYAFLVTLPDGALDRVLASPRVSAAVPYHPAYKLSRALNAGKDGQDELLVLLFPDASMEDALATLRAGGAAILQTSQNTLNQIIRLRPSPLSPAAIARMDEVAWIEPYLRPQLHNDQCQWVVQTGRFQQRRLWELGLRGQGQIVGISDSGIRTTHQQFFDPAVPLNNFGDYPTHRKIVFYGRTVPDLSIAFGDEASLDFHGTHTSCSLAGSDDPTASDPRDGMAKEARIFFLDGGSPGQESVFIPLDLNELFLRPYVGNEAGAARVMTNSWGNAAHGVYDVLAMTADQFTYEHPDFLPFFSSGNDGGPTTVGSPATAKSVVTVGGTQNGTADNTYFSATSRGPTADGRLKPTLCAPAVLSSAYGGNDTEYVTSQGTSMASPAAAGCAVLMRQYLTEGWYPTGAKVAANAMPAPSSALLKAMAINSADPDIQGYNVPDANVGWGRIDADKACYVQGDTVQLGLIDDRHGLLTGEYVEYQVFITSAIVPFKVSLVWTDYPGVPMAANSLVNDLNLSVSDGVNVYKGNLYANGQSVTGGSFDNRNVEECVRRDSPTLGLWTIRVEAGNIPFGPQSFALAMTGALGGTAGTVLLDKPTYGGTDTLRIRVIDWNAEGPVQVRVHSTTENAPEALTLSGANGVYTGSFPLTLDPAAAGDGLLSVSHGDVIQAQYHDASPTSTISAAAEVNIAPPVISDVQPASVNETEVTLSWTTSTASDSRVLYGPDAALGLESETAPNLSTRHQVTVKGLAPKTMYYYDVVSRDRQGNETRDDNGGLHYTVTSDLNHDVLLAIGDASFPNEQIYRNALNRLGWTYTVWTGAAAAVPYVGDRTTGMASYKAVIWQTGFEQYPVFNRAARDSVAKLNTLGSRFAVYSHDVAWDFGDPSSPDYTTATNDWFMEQFKASWQLDPLRFSTLSGASDDPISGPFLQGIPYTPIRDGGAGDEVLPLGTGGTAAGVFYDDYNGPGLVAVRWIADTASGDSARAVWGGTARRVSSNFFEWSRINASVSDDAVRAEVLDRTLIWLIGHDHPTVTLLSPAGGETLTGASVPISWQEAADSSYTVSARSIFYSEDSGQSWRLIADHAGPSPYNWDLTSVLNGARFRVRVVVVDDGSRTLSAAGASAADFTINRSGGDILGPIALAGSVRVSPNPVAAPEPVDLTASVSDLHNGNSLITAAEWSHGLSPAPAGLGTPMNGIFESVSLTVRATLDSRTLTGPTETIWVRARDAAGNWGNPGSLTFRVNSSPEAIRFFFYGSRPNPFRAGSGTMIRYDLAERTSVLIEVFGPSGRRVRTLIDRVQEAGPQQEAWDGRDETGRLASSGMYFYHFRAGGYTATRKLTLIR